MAFTVDDAKDLAEINIDEAGNIEDAQALAWAKEFMRQKVDSRRWTEGTKEYDATADEWYDLPDDFVTDIGVVDVGGYRYERYTYRSESITFRETGTYTLTYRQMPSALASVAATVPLPDTYLDPMAYFMSSRYRSQDDSEDQDAMHWMAECDAALRKAIATARPSNTPMRVRMRW